VKLHNKDAALIDQQEIPIASGRENQQTHQALIIPNEGISITRMTMSAGKREFCEGMFVQTQSHFMPMRPRDCSAILVNAVGEKSRSVISQATQRS